MDFRPPTETQLLSLEDGTRIILDETKRRWSFARHGRTKASDMARYFDAYWMRAPTQSVRHFVLRPPGQKVRMGDLASGLADFAALYNTVSGRLVHSRRIRPILTAIHVRYAADLDRWDIHAHCMWDVNDEDLDDVFVYVCKHFSDPWLDSDKVRSPRALANYLGTEAINYREVPKWPASAILELWNLPSYRLLRPAGSFAAFRRENKGKRLVRGAGGIAIETTTAARPRLPSQRPRPPVGDGERVVAIKAVRVHGEVCRCAVIKRDRVIDRADRGCAHVSTYLAYGEYPAKSSAPEGGAAENAFATQEPKEDEPSAGSGPKPYGKSADRLEPQAVEDGSESRADYPEGRIEVFGGCGSALVPHMARCIAGGSQGSLDGLYGRSTTAVVQGHAREAIATDHSPLAASPRGGGTEDRRRRRSPGAAIAEAVSIGLPIRESWRLRVWPSQSGRLPVPVARRLAALRQSPVSKRMFHWGTPKRDLP